MDTNNWKWFYLSQLFDIDTGKDLIYSELLEGEYPVVGHKAENNGVTATTQFLTTHKLYNHNNTISLADRGNFFATIQTHDFYVGTRVKALVAKFNATRERLLFICVLINKEQYRFSYGRNCCDRIDDFKLKLPIDSNNNPDWQWIDNYVNNVIIPKSPQKAKSVLNNDFDINPITNNRLCLNIENWKWFDYSQIFTVTGSKTTPDIELEEAGFGVYPYVTTQAVNNGVEGFFNIATEKGNVLTVDSAVLGYCSYQSKDFSASDHVEKLIPKFNMSTYIAMFLVTIINKEQYRYNYGRKCSQKKLKKSRLKLPAIKNAKGEYEPDWQWMEDYIKGLPYSGCL